MAHFPAIIRHIFRLMNTGISLTRRRRSVKVWDEELERAAEAAANLFLLL